jgi:CBS-domain-containing membrane protein
MPVIDDEANVVGVVSLDDLLQVCGRALDDAVNATRSAQSLEAWRRP